MRGRFSGTRRAPRAAARGGVSARSRQLDLAGPLEEVRERLDEILERERSALSFRAEDDARMREAFLDALPPDAPGQVRELQDYRFVDPRGAADVRRAHGAPARAGHGRVLPEHGRGHAERSRREELARFRDMLAELNDMIERRERGEPYDFDGFMQRYGDLFPDEPKTLDELLENMARRMAAMSRLMASLSPEQRAELQALAEQVMQDMDLAFEVDRLGANLARDVPGHGVG